MCTRYTYIYIHLQLVRAEYRRPRDVLLSLVGEFIGRATTRLLELNGSKGSGSSEGKPVELLDSKSHAVNI